MFNSRIYAILKRELKERLFSKAFIILTIMIPAIMVIMIGIQILLNTSESKDLKFVFSCEDSTLINKFKTEFEQAKFVSEKRYKFTYVVKTKVEFSEYIKTQKTNLLGENLTGIIYVPNTSLKDKKIEYYSKSPQNLALSREIEQPVNKILLESYFANKTLSEEDLKFARKGIDFTPFKVSKEEEAKKEGYGNLIVSYLVSFLLYISLLMIGQVTMQSVIEEKSNRIVEVILSSVSPSELMTGKILGASITGLVQMGIWLATLITFTSSSLMTLPPEVVINLKPELVLFVFVNFFVGLLIYVGLFAAFGSIFDNAQDAASGIWPIMMLIIIPFFIALALIQNPTAPFAEFASLCPFSAIIVMPARMALGDVPLWQTFFAFGVNILTMLGVFKLAGKIFRVGILTTGKKPKWSEVVRWLKYKY